MTNWKKITGSELEQESIRYNDTLDMLGETIEICYRFADSADNLPDSNAFRGVAHSIEALSDGIWRHIENNGVGKCVDFSYYSEALVVIGSVSYFYRLGDRNKMREFVLKQSMKMGYLPQNQIFNL